MCSEWLGFWFTTLPSKIATQTNATIAIQSNLPEADTPGSGYLLKVPPESGFSLRKNPLRSGHPRKRTRTPIPRSQTKKNLSKVDTSSKNLHWKRLESSENGLKTFPSPFYQYVIYCMFTLLIYNWFGSGWICRQVIPKWKWKLFVKTSGKWTPLSSGHQTQAPRCSLLGGFTVVIFSHFLSKIGPCAKFSFFFLLILCKISGKYVQRFLR